MTRVFVYEYCCAVGLGRDESDPAHSLYREGRAMRDAVADDFRRLPGVEVVTLDSTTSETFDAELRERVIASDWTLLIAPEIGMWSRQVAERVESYGGQLLSSTSEGISVAGLKAELSERWLANGVMTPRVRWWEDWFHSADRFPTVFKPANGAGSHAVTLVRNEVEYGPAVEAARDAGIFEDNLIYQPYIPGRAASVAFLIGPRDTAPLLPTFQVLSTDGRFTYLGGELPTRPDLAERAVALGRRAVECVPGLRGYVGVDLILGDAADGSQDYAIEINPRLTTSYVGLRQLAEFNLAGAMLAVAAGEPIGDLRWNPGRVRFLPDGRTDYDPTPGDTFG